MIQNATACISHKLVYFAEFALTAQLMEVGGHQSAGC